MKQTTDQPQTKSMFPDLLPPWKDSLSAGTTPVSVHMIVKDEAPFIPRALRSLIMLQPAQVIIGDTGSTDTTRSIAGFFGCQVIDVPWQDHFAAARNTVLAQCTQPYVMWLDADEELEEGSAKVLRQKLAAGLDEDFHAVRFTESSMSMYQCRLWKRSANATWRGRVHEKVQMKWPWRRHSDIIIIQHADDRRRNKQLRNIRLVEMDLAEDPTNYDQHFHAAVLYNQLADYDQSTRHALAYMTKAPHEDMRTRLFMQYLLAWTELFVHHNIQACINKLAGAVVASPCSAELWSLMADAYWHAGRLPDALALYENAIAFGQHEQANDVLWLVDLSKYDSYPREQIRKLEAMGIERPKTMSCLGGPMGL